jgi:hypothetical protein
MQVRDRGDFRAVDVAEGKMIQQISDGVNPRFMERFRAFCAKARNEADGGKKVESGINGAGHSGSKNISRE